MEYLNRLTPIKFVKIGKDNRSIWLYKCKCGKVVSRRMDNVNRNITKSCGCIVKENPTNVSHRMSKTKFYSVWRNINARCKNSNRLDYKRYGGRGIKVVWKSFKEFKNDMFLGYKTGLTIERINNNGNYCKENCKWATNLEQSNNRRSNKLIFYKGETLSVGQWARKLKINPWTLYTRLSRLKWPLERALCKLIPIHSKPKS